MIQIKKVSNKECIKCFNVHKDMIQVGVFIMCVGCFEEEFGGVYRINEDNKEKYYEWLNEYKLKYS